jgi:hypothetical protein
MGNYEQLKQAVSDVIKTNGNQEITGAILQSALLSIISDSIRLSLFGHCLIARLQISSYYHL